MNLSVGGGFL